MKDRVRVRIALAIAGSMLMMIALLASTEGQMVVEGNVTTDLLHNPKWKEAQHDFELDCSNQPESTLL